MTVNAIRPHQSLKAFIDIQYFWSGTEGNAIGGACAIHQQGRLAIRVDAPQSASARFSS